MSIDKKEILIRQFEHWLERNAEELSKNNIEISDNLHVIPPACPMRGNIKEWIKIIKNAAFKKFKFFKKF